MNPRVTHALMIAAFGAFVLIGNADSAFAAGDLFQPVNTMASQILQFLTGTFATTVATIMVAVCGYTAFRGMVPWGMAISIIVGIVFIFGGAQIVSALSSGAGSGG